MLEMRSHGPWYIKGMPAASLLRNRLAKVSTKQELLDIIEEYKNYKEKEDQ